MGFKLFTSEDFFVMPNEELEISVNLQKENRGVVHGVVKADCELAKNCVVKLFKKVKGKHGETLCPVGFTFTDCLGQFLFPICDTGDKVFYVIKVFCLHETSRSITLVSRCKDDGCDDDCKDC